jgi:hypothetical protein
MALIYSGCWIFKELGELNKSVPFFLRAKADRGSVIDNRLARLRRGLYHCRQTTDNLQTVCRLSADKLQTLCRQITDSLGSYCLALTADKTTPARGPVLGD